MSVIYDRVVLIGLGLIVGLMVLVMCEKGFVGFIVGYVCSVEMWDIVLEIGLVDQVFVIVVEVVQGVDLIVLVVLVGVMDVVVVEIVLYLKLGVMVMDVGLVKQVVIQVVVLYIFEGVYFVLGYFLVGIEYFGFKVGFVSLYQNCWWLFILVEGCDEVVIVWLEGLVQVMGVKIECMDVQYYDLVLVVISYILYLIVYMMVGVVDYLKWVMELEVV